ncbi:MAG: glycosyl transferase, partial [Acidobacteriota bacterium]
MSSAMLGFSIILFAVSFLASLFGVGLFTRWSRNRGVFDIPNVRSSHSTPTPRGAGLIIVIVCLTGYVVVGFALGLPVSWGYLAGAIIVSAVSWLDDLYSLSFWTRFLFHLLAAGI